MITKRSVIKALAKYGISFSFPRHASHGEVITCWRDLYERNGDTEKLRKAILTDTECFFTVSNIPANYLASLRLVGRVNNS